ncbi:MAG: hypothetical protein ACRDKA_06685 [Actinomycetota bacterium]
MEKKKAGWVAGGTLVAMLIGGGAAIATATDGDDDGSLSGSALERATAAALAHTGGGRVIETEIGDDGAAYGVEIRLDSGRVVEVNLDEDFSVVGQEGEDDGPSDQEDGPSDD